MSLWAKSYDTQNSSKYTKIENKKLFLKNFNWIKFWIEKHFFYKIFEFLLIFTFIILMVYFYFIKIKSTNSENFKDRFILFFLSILSIFFWLNTVPQFRFGFASIMILFYILFDLILNLKIKFNRGKLVHLLILALVILNFKNFNRIKNEFQREDFYKFTNFPFYNEKEIKNDYSNFKRDKFFYVEILK